MLGINIKNLSKFSDRAREKLQDKKTNKLVERKDRVMKKHSKHLMEVVRVRKKLVSIELK